MKHTIISIGELLWDLLPEKTILGGAPSNLAYRLNELGENCHLVSRVGRDAYGEDAIRILKDMGLSTSHIQFDDNFPTGTVKVSFDEFRNPDYIITPDVAYDMLELRDDLINLASQCQCIAFGTLAQRADKSRETIAGLLKAGRGAIKFLDINLRKACYTKESISQSLAFANILKANHHEADQLNRDFNIDAPDIPGICREFSRRFDIHTILVTLEENGVFLFDTHEGEHYIPGHRIALEDPLGAGDAFSAGFIHSMLHGKTLKEASEHGNRLGALVATKQGATQKINPDELNHITHNKERIFNSAFLKYAN